MAFSAVDRDKAELKQKEWDALRKEADDHLLNSLESLLKMIVLGNAGGAIAALSFIGTMVGANPDNTFNQLALFPLTVFLFGLLVGGLARLAIFRFFTHLRSSMESTPTVDKSVMKKSDWWYAKIPYLCGVAFVALTIGVCSGLWFLFGLSVYS